MAGGARQPWGRHRTGRRVAHRGRRALIVAAAVAMAGTCVIGAQLLRSATERTGSGQGLPLAARTWTTAAVAPTIPGRVVSSVTVGAKTTLNVGSSSTATGSVDDPLPLATRSAEPFDSANRSSVRSPAPPRGRSSADRRSPRSISVPGVAPPIPSPPRTSHIAATRSSTSSGGTEPGPTEPAAAAAIGDDEAYKASSVSLAFTGDVLSHRSILEQARADADGDGYSFAKMFAGVSPVVESADWAICHQETVIDGPDDSDVEAYPSFRAPHSLAADQKSAGWDACDTASNHTADHGQEGIDTTLQALDNAGIQHTGSYRSAAEAQQVTVYQIKGVHIGHIAVTYGLNAGAPPHPWSVNLVDVPRITSQARQLKQAGADIVVVSIHAGAEQQQQPSGDQIRWDEEIMLSPDVDLLIGAHAHVVQPIKRLDDGRYLVYGLGNLLALQSKAADAPPNRDGIVVMPTFTRGADGTYRVSQLGYVPTFTQLTAGTIRVTLAPDASHQRVRKIVSQYGADVVDLTARFR